MGFLDDLKDKAEDFGNKAKEGLGTAKDKASDVIDDVKDRLDKDDDETSTDKDDDETSTDKVEDAVNYDPGAVETASAEGIGAAAAGVEPTLEPASASAESADLVEPEYEPMATTQAPDDAYDLAAEAEPTPEPASEPMAPSQTPDEAYDALLDGAAAKSEYRSDSTP